MLNKRHAQIINKTWSGTYIMTAADELYRCSTWLIEQFDRSNLKQNKDIQLDLQIGYI